MIATAKNVAKMVIPEKTRRFIRWCIDSNYRAAKARERDRKLTMAVYQLTGGRIVAGPFRDLHYIDADLIGGACKLLGTYERELNGPVERIIAKKCATVFNLGAGEGYYAVGLAKRIPGARIVCYELMERYQGYIRTLAEINGVADRVEVHGRCDPSSFADHLARAEGPIAIICDVEGCEYDLLDPLSIPQLKNADVLVELHDMYRKGVSKALKNRFAPTHDVTRLHSTRRTRDEFPSHVKLDPSLQVRALDEDRGGTMYWYWMEAKELPPRHEDAKAPSVDARASAVTT